MSDFLFARPSVLEGIGRNLDLFGTMQMYNASDTPEQADTLAFFADLAALKSDAAAAYAALVKNYESSRKE
ncbi:MAG: hypothetical protein WCG80_09865 [Spirochaetales bacterium]